MLTFSQSIRACLEFQRCTNAVLTIAWRPDPGRHWNARDAALGLFAWDADRESEAAASASQCCARRQPGRCQKRLLTDMKKYNFYISVYFKKRLLRSQ